MVLSFEPLAAAIGEINRKNGLNCAVGLDENVPSKPARRIFLTPAGQPFSQAKARELATEEIAVLCAGSNGRIELEDVYTAGVLCEYLISMTECSLDDGAQIALTVRRQFADPLEPLSKSRAAEIISNVGLEADIGYAAEVSRSTIVPIFIGRSGNALIFK